MSAPATLSFFQRLYSLALLALACPALLLFVVVPLSVPMQLLLGCSMMALMLLLNRNRSYAVTLTMMVMSLAVSTRYLYWRSTETLSFGNGVEAFLGIGLYLAELYAWLILALGYFQSILPLRRPIQPLPDDVALWPTVDVYIPTYNESLSVVQDTVLAALNLDYPADKLRVYLLDDGRRPEFGAFAAAAGAGYITRSDNAHAKAGNLNNALRKTGGELICIFDCDHITTRAFLQATVGLFLKDSRLALVQTPHHFYSPDPFERNLATGRDVPNEGELFYGPVQQGNDYWNAAFFCGSCAVIRRSALEETNGFAVETVTEDAHTALKLQRKGWNTAFIAVPLAAGLATERLSLHIGQRMRWARGMTQILRRDNPLLGRGLTLPQRLCYLNAMLHFQFALPRIIFLTAPISYLLLGQNIIASSAPAIFAYALPHLVHSITTNARIHGRHRHSFWGEIYETALAFHLLKPTLATLLDPTRGKFNVTDKGGLLDRSFFDIRLVKPHILTACVLVFSIAVGLVRHYWIDWFPSDFNVLMLNIAWANFSLVTLLAAIAVAREKRQVRTTTRLEVQLPATLCFSNGRTLQGVTRDISMGGLRLTVSGTDQPLSKEVEAIELQCGERTVVLPVELRGAEAQQIRLRFRSLNIPQRRELVRLVMGRADAWLHNSPVKSDQPLKSLGGVLKNVLALTKTPLDNTPVESPQNRVALPDERDIMPKIQRGATSVAQLGALLALALAGTGLWSAESQAQTLALPPLTGTARAPGPGGLPANLDGTVEVVRFDRMGVRDRLTLRGPHAEAGLPFSISRQQVVSEARLDLHVQYGEQLPEGAWLEVLLNGERLTELELASGKAVDTFMELPVNPLLLLPHNRLNLKLRTDAKRCENPADSPLAVTLAKDSGFSLVLNRLPLDNDLSLLPAPFFDEAQMNALRLPMVLPSVPDDGVLRSAAIVASHFGALAAYRGAEFPVLLDELPMGNAVVFLPAGATVAGLTAPVPDGPSLSIVDNPRDPPAKLLLVGGDTPDALRDAATALALQREWPKGASLRVTPVANPPRQPYDAPRWLPSDRPARFAELGDATLSSDSLAPETMSVTFHAAPDTFVWNGANIPMRIRYRFPEGDWFDATRSHLNLSLNGRYLTSVPVLRPGVFEKIKNHFGFQTRQEDALVEIPTYLIFGNNQLDFYFDIRHKPDPTCALELPKNALSFIDGDSVIDLTHTRHFAEQPNLAFFAGSGFPFTRLADLAETAVVLPSAPAPGELEAMLGLLGRFGRATGYPAVRVEVLRGDAHLDSVRHRDLLLIGRLDGRLNLPALLEGTPFRIEGAQVRIAPPTLVERLRTLVVQGDWTREDDEADRYLSGYEQFRGLLGRRSPYDPSRVMVLALAAEEQWLPRLVAGLSLPQVNAHVRGDLVFFENGERVGGFRVGSPFAYGELPWPIHVRWLLSERPLLLVLFLGLSTLLISAGLYPLLRARAIRRLSQ